MNTCSVPDCERAPRGLRDMCKMHLDRVRVGLPLDMPLSSRPDTFDKKWMPGPNGCRLWTGATSDNGYGNYRGALAHRVAYERAKGPIPAGLHIDHLCRVRNCVNPDHLEAVTQAENNRRTRKARCIHGHDYTPENTYLRPDGKGRQCRTCIHERAVKLWRDRRALAIERDREWWQA